MQTPSPLGLLALVQIYYSIDLFTPSLAYCVCKEIHYSRGQTLFHYTSRKTCSCLLKFRRAKRRLLSCALFANMTFHTSGSAEILSPVHVWTIKPYLAQYFCALDYFNRAYPRHVARTQHLRFESHNRSSSSVRRRNSKFEIRRKRRSGKCVVQIWVNN